MAFRVRIESFEGPFDLLLSLVSQQKVNIGAISITEIIDQYLAEISHMPAVDLDVASDFLYVAATLLRIKAESLIPRDEPIVDEELRELSPSEARDILVERLITYKQYKNAARDLENRFNTEGKMFARPYGPDPQFLKLVPDFLLNTSLDELGAMAASALARREAFLLDAEHIAAKPIPVEVHVRAIHERIKNRKTLQFSDLIDERTSTAMVVVTFLAILELYKRNMVHLTQDIMFEDIRIDFIEGSGELFLSDDDALTSTTDASASSTTTSNKGE